MDLKWLEDFVSLAETRSFSRSAELRHVTQPAFSRRIQALEAWLGTELIDRSVYPTRFTQAGQVFHEQALTLLSQMRETRALLRGQAGAANTTIEFALPHTLSLTFFPRWLQRIAARLETASAPDALSVSALNTRLRALNVHDALLSLVEGGCDLVMGYHHPSHPVMLDPARYDMAVLGRETMSPFSAPLGEPVPGGGEPRHALPIIGNSEKIGAAGQGATATASGSGNANARAPFLAYTLNAYLGRMTAYIIANTPVPLGLEKVYETDMAEGLKAMTTAGHGIAFLPHSAVADELLSGRLVRLDAPGSGPYAEKLTISMEIRLYRDRLAAQNSDAHQALISRVWEVALAEAAEVSAR
jgi:LysR family transcriptional regulator, hypochlorite-specific transcription factor HypT